MSGQLYIWKGAMGTGKTHALLLEASYLRKIGKRGQVLKVVPGAQIEHLTISSRSGISLPGCQIGDNIRDLISFSGHRDDGFVAIDEVQFLGADVVDVIARACDRGVHVLAAGFDYWFDGKEDGVIKALDEMADTVYGCSGRCELCNKERTKYSLRIGGSDEMVDTGAEYKAVCEVCYVRKMQ